MSINANHFRYFIVRPTLQAIDLFSRNAEELLMLTWAQETLGATYLKQGYKTIDDGRGVGLGPYSMEPATHDDIFENFLRFRPELQAKVNHLSGDSTAFRPADEMIGNFYYATAMARVHYYRAQEPLPPFDKPDLLAIYWYVHYNKSLNTGFPSEALANYKRIVLGLT